MEYSKTFKDSLGREWTAELTVAQARNMKDIAGVSLDELIPKPEEAKNAKDVPGMLPLAQFLADPFRVFDLWYLMIKPAADKLGLTKDQVGEGIGAAEIEKVSFAVLRAINDFFQWDPTRQAMLRKIAQAGQQVMSAAKQRIDKELDKIDIAAAVSQSLDALPGLNAEQLNADLQQQLLKRASDSPAT